MVPEVLSEVVIGQAVNQDMFNGLCILAAVAQGTIANSNTVEVGSEANFASM